MVLVRVWAVLSTLSPVSKITCLLVLLFPSRKPVFRHWLGWLMPWVLPIAIAMYVRENWRIMLIDSLMLWDRVTVSPPNPTLTVDNSVPDTPVHILNASSFKLRWTSIKKQLSLEYGQRTIWRSRANNPFVSVASATSNVAEAHGNFAIKDRIEWQCVGQRITHITSETNGAATVRGYFDDSTAMCSNLRWTISFGIIRHQVSFDLRLDGPSAVHVNRLQLTHDLEAGVHASDEPQPEVAVWGLGVQFRHYNMLGHCVPVFVTEGGIGRGSSATQPLTLLLNALAGGSGGNDYTTYAASASYITSNAVGMVLENSELALFDVASAGCKEAGILQGGRFGSTGRVGGMPTRQEATRTAVAWASILHAVTDPPSELRSGGKSTEEERRGGIPREVSGGRGIAISVHASRLRGRIFGADTSPLPSGQSDSDEQSQSDGFESISHIMSALEQLTEYTGRQTPPPAWADAGAIIGVQGGSSKVRKVVHTLRAHGIPLAAVWMQDWVGMRDTAWGSRLWWNWVLDKHVYNDWHRLREELFPTRMLTYVNSMFSDLGGTSRMNASRHLFAEAKQKGYLVAEAPLHTPQLDLRDATLQSSNPPERSRVESPLSSSTAATQSLVRAPHMVEVAGYWAAMLDLTNPEACTWMRDTVLVREMLGGAGLSDGWMADFGEALPCDGVRLHDGTSACAYHNKYPVDWASLNWEAARLAGVEKDVLIFSRSGHTTSPGVANLFWLGDQLHTWDECDGLASAITATLSGGLSGYALTHSDVGGYTSIDLHRGVALAFGVTGRWVRERELLLRWIEANAFSGAVLRTHEGLLPEGNHQIWSDEETLAHFRRFALVFAAFRTYRRSLMKQAAERGWPIVRHPVLHFPYDRVLLDDRAEAEGGEGRIREFMLGPDWLVVPVLAAGETTVRGYMPAGEWVPLWDAKLPDTTRLESGLAYGSIWGPGWRLLPAPLGQPAVYHRREAQSAHGIRMAMHEHGLL